MRFLPLILAVAAATCQPSPRDRLVEWRPMEALNRSLPEGVRVFEGANRRLPLRAWYVSVDPDAPGVDVHVRASDDDDGLETATEFADDEGACVVVNGGYFRMDLTPTRHVGLLMEDRRMIEPAIGSVLRGEVRYPTARSTLGFTAGGTPHIAWVSSRSDSLYAWSEPPPNRPGVPASPPDLTRARIWPVSDALAAGPAVLVNGQKRITVDEEVFFGSTIPEVHPRTAAGIASGGRLILMVVDGRQPFSRGASLDELAELLADVGAVHGLNLDGGGSTSLVVNGKLVNRPAGTSVQREIMSAVVVDCGRPNSP